MSEPHDQAALALANAAAGQALTNAWHDRMREKDRLAPPRPKAKDDHTRGCASPLGGAGWWKGP
jgi:hypothetical protein